MTRIVRRTPKIDSKALVGDRAHTMTDEERSLVCAVLRTCSGAGPYPEPESLPFFRLHYVLACLKKRMRYLKTNRIETVRGALRKLGSS